MKFEEINNLKDIANKEIEFFKRARTELWFFMAFLFFHLVFDISIVFPICFLIMAVWDRVETRYWATKYYMTKFMVKKK